MEDIHYELLYILCYSTEDMILTVSCCHPYFSRTSCTNVYKM